MAMIQTLLFFTALAVSMITIVIAVIAFYTYAGIKKGAQDDARKVAKKVAKQFLRDERDYIKEVIEKIATSEGNRLYEDLFPDARQKEKKNE